MRVGAGWIAAALTAALVSGCASMQPDSKQHHVSSVLAYLYPQSVQTPPAADPVAEIRVPVRLGIAFVPDVSDPHTRLLQHDGLPERDRLRLAEKVRDSFSHYPFIASIRPVPTEYLEPRGGFANLDRIAAMLQLDLIALVSYDQVQTSDASGWSFLYWTGIGAYTISGDRYEILTVVDTAVFDVKSRRLLMRADGISRGKGAASWVGFSGQARQARARGFDQAVDSMIARLHSELSDWRERAPKDPGIRLIIPPDYKPEASQASVK